jgi:hypothetical protein
VFLTGIVFATRAAKQARLGYRLDSVELDFVAFSLIAKIMPAQIGRTSFDSSWALIG